QNWAQTFVAHPELFFRPKSERELRDILRAAQTAGRHVTVVGSGHSPGDNVCTSDYLVSLDHFSDLIEVRQDTLQVKVGAGMRLYQLHSHLQARGLAMENLGSISDQSMAGFMATSTHGSSLKHSTLSQQVVAFTIMLADGTCRACSMKENERLFRAGLVSLGALGVIINVTLQVTKAFDIRATQTIVPFQQMISTWKSDQLWNQAEYVRVWWFPYSDKAVVWAGDRTQPDVKKRHTPKSWMASDLWAYHINQALLYAGRFVPSAIPAFERLVFGKQWGTTLGKVGESIEQSNVALNMNCLFSQYVDEWSVPLEKGPEAVERLSLWLQGKHEEAGIPFSSEGIYAHAPIELRVTAEDKDAYISTAQGGPVCYIGVIMYKPYHSAISYRRYFEAYEYLMQSLGGRPHWAKQHAMTPTDLKQRYPHLQTWLDVRAEVDPEQLFTTDYHRRHLL
ncbi:D-arabinono-1,4-lactone oxidase-domain-containing protein, partial [Protomyces lactucae-debilis]